MNNLQTLINEYIKFCKTQKRLDHKTINAYRIDLTQFTDLLQLLTIDQITITTLEDYIINNTFAMFIAGVISNINRHR